MSATTRPAAARRRGFDPVRDVPVVGWLAALVVVAVLHPWVPAPRWLLLHLLLLGAVSSAIHVWSQYFADALLHSAPAPRELRARRARLALHNTGALLVIGGVATGAWPAVLAGGALVGGAAGWHGLALWRQVRGSLGARFSGTVRYYVAAAGCLAVGAVLGVLLARGPGDPWHARLLLAHVTVNLLGWVGLAVLGTLLTLWPTMLRTPMVAGAETASRRALPVLLGGVALAAGGAGAGATAAAVGGLTAYLVGVGLLAGPFVRTARRTPPRTYPTLAVACGAGWLAVGLAWLVVALVVGAVGGGDPAEAVSAVAPVQATGFAAQVLLGALSYLVPVALRGGPHAVRAATAVLDRGSALRIAATNAALVVLALPAPPVVRVLASTVVLTALGAFLPLLVLAMRASRRERTAPGADPAARAAAEVVRSGRPAGQLRGLAVTGVALVALAVAAGVAVDPRGPAATAAAGGSGSGSGVQAGAGAVAATGETTTVRVEARGMRFRPGTVTVPAGNRLVVELVNADEEDVHDLVLESGQRTGRLAPGERAELVVDVVARDLKGWCSVVGHRQMGMVLAVRVTGAPGNVGGTAAVGPDPAADPGAAGPDLAADPGPAFRAHDAALPPPYAAPVHRVTLRVTEVVREVAPGWTQRLWTYNGTAPGPVLHGRVGDVFEVRLVNDGSIGHSVDFHAGALAPDRPMRTLPPGRSLTYRFTATRAGMWMYHCSTTPMSAHIANGMFGAVVVEPPDLPPVDRSYVLVQSELYLGGRGEVVDVGKLAAERPDAVAFNGYPNQYAHRPLPARVGERVRVWVLDAGPNRSSSFHVVGGQFDTVYAEGAHLLRRGAGPGGGAGGGPGGAQALALTPGQGGFVELSFPEPGTYPFVSHAMVDAERGARGLFRVG